MAFIVRPGSQSMSLARWLLSLALLEQFVAEFVGFAPCTALRLDSIAAAGLVPCTFYLGDDAFEVPIARSEECYGLIEDVRKSL
jgi:hypothetical protein